MDKLIDLFLKTPFAKRLTAGLVERLIILVVGGLLGLLKIDVAPYMPDIVKFAAEFAPEAAAVLILALIAIKRIKKTEVTIEVTRQAPGGVSRAAIDTAVANLTPVEKKQVLQQAKAEATASAA